MRLVQRRPREDIQILCTKSTSENLHFFAADGVILRSHRGQTEESAICLLPYYTASWNTIKNVAKNEFARDLYCKYGDVVFIKDAMAHGPLLGLSCELELLFGPQQVLDEQSRGRKVDAPSGPYQLLAQGAQQMGLARTGVAEGEDVFAPVKEGAVQQRADLLGDFSRHTLHLEGAEAFVEGQTRFAQKALDAVLAAGLAFALGQLEEILLVTERFLLRALGLFFVAFAHGGQPQLFEVAEELASNLRWSFAHVTPIFYSCTLILPDFAS